MQKFLKVFVATIALLGVFTLFMPSVRADIDTLKPVCTDGGAAAQNSEFCRNAKEESTTRTFVFGQNSVPYIILQTVVLVVGIASVITIIIGGIKYIVSGGDSAGIESAKNTVLYAVIGLVVALFAQVIIATVLSRFI